MLKDCECKNPRIAILGGSFNPPCKHHYAIAEELLRQFDSVLLTPCGKERSSKPSLSEVTARDRKVMIALTFSQLSKVEFDFSDLDNNIFTPTVRLFERYRDRYPSAELWFVVGGDIVAGGNMGQSEIQRSPEEGGWVEGKRVWENFNFAVINHSLVPVDPKDLPPQSRLVNMQPFFGRATLVRQRIAKRESIDDLVLPEIASYISRHNLYGPAVSIADDIEKRFFEQGD